jgi:hypothetical protein
MKMLKPVSRRAGYLLLSVMLVISGNLGGLLARAAVSEAQAAALVEALRLAAPPTGINNDGLYSDWQIKPDNIARWSRRCHDRELTPQEFAADARAARRILVCKLHGVLEEQYITSHGDEALAVRCAAAWWMTGDPERYGDPATAAYTHRVLDFYRQQLGKR